MRTTRASLGNRGLEAGAAITYAFYWEAVVTGIRAMRELVRRVIVASALASCAGFAAFAQSEDQDLEQETSTADESSATEAGDGPLLTPLTLNEVLQKRSLSETVVEAEKPLQVLEVEGVDDAAGTMEPAGAAASEKTSQPSLARRIRDRFEGLRANGSNNKTSDAAPATTPVQSVQQRTPNNEPAPSAPRRPTIPRDELRAIDRIVDRLEVVRPNDDPPSDDDLVIRFDAFYGDPIPGGEALTDQYQDSHGVTFGRGATIETCRRPSTNATAYIPPSPCSYDRAASGRNTGYYSLQGGQSLRVNFARAITGLSVKINPTGASLDEPFQMRMTGFDASGKEVASSETDFFWRQDAFSWPTTASLAADGGRMTSVTMELRRPRRANQSVRFLFDDLALTFAPDVTPVIEDLLGVEAPPRIPNAEIVRSPNDPELVRELRLYPPATRIRVPIDWAAANLAVQEQAARSITAAALSDRSAIDAAELPVLLPTRADATSLSVVGQGDSYHADFERDGRGYSIYGTRVLTRIRPMTGAPPLVQNLRFIELEYGLGASFSLYGPAYMVTRYCLDDSPEEDAACMDKDELSEVIGEIAVVIGAAGEGSP